MSTLEAQLGRKENYSLSCAMPPSLSGHKSQKGNVVAFFFWDSRDILKALLPNALKSSVCILPNILFL